MAQEEASGAPEAASAVPAEQGPDIFSISLDWQRWWTIVPEIVALLCAGALPVVVMANVLARYTNWYHVIWATDVVKVLFLWLVFLGGALAVKYEAHVRMAMLSDRFVEGGKIGRFWEFAIRLSPLLVGAILLVLGVRLVEISMVRELQTLRISAGYFMPVVPISGVLMIFYVLRSLGSRRGSWSPARTTHDG